MNPLLRYSRITAALLASGCVLLAGCANFNSSARLLAQQNEEALQRQQLAERDDRPDQKAVYLDLIGQMQGRGLYFASLAHIDAYERKHGASPNLQRLRADALRETEQADAADTIYRSLLNTSEAAHAWHGRGLLAGRRDDYRAAVAAIREAARLEPTDPMILSDLGYALLYTGDVAAARVSIAQAAELAPDNRKIVGNLALYLLVAGNQPSAGAVMDKAKLPIESRRAVYRLADNIVGRNATTESAEVKMPPLVDGSAAAPTSELRLRLDRFATRW